MPKSETGKSLVCMATRLELASPQLGERKGEMKGDGHASDALQDTVRFISKFTLDSCGPGR
jgi:hypothetical protein